MDDCGHTYTETARTCACIVKWQFSVWDQAFRKRTLIWLTLIAIVECVLVCGSHWLPFYSCSYFHSIAHCCLSVTHWKVLLSFGSHAHFVLLSLSLTHALSSHSLRLHSYAYKLNCCIALQRLYVRRIFILLISGQVWRINVLIVIAT